VMAVTPASNPEQERAQLRAAVDGDGGAANARVFPTAEGMVEPLTLEDVKSVQSELEAAITQASAAVAPSKPRAKPHAVGLREVPVKLRPVHSVGSPGAGTSTVPAAVFYDARQ
jgi:hypothetical protein